MITPTEINKTTVTLRNISQSVINTNNLNLDNNIVTTNTKDEVVD